jgi:hypothetical protein
LRDDQSFALERIQCRLGVNTFRVVRIIITLIEATDFFAVKALVSDLHPRAECTDCRKVLHGETGGLRCCGEATIAKALPRTPYGSR